jgi:coenzyme F420-0:L-glutamate ligase / coenzyme F420-1:gamma-L-glutamate ligase
VTQLTVIPIAGMPEIVPGAPLAALLLAGIQRARLLLQESDVLVVTQKVVSKAEGRIVDLASVQPGAEALALAARTQFDARHVEVILRESTRVVRVAPRVLVTETRQGFVCANAGVDRSNTGGEDLAVLLPVDPDASAAALRQRLAQATGWAVGVLISDSFGRAWREGQVNVAIGAAGVACLTDYRGARDDDGYQLQGTVLATADELAAAAELVMRKLDRVPAAVVRGLDVRGEGDARVLRRDRALDLFR